MPTTNVQRVSTHTFPEIGPDVKQVKNLNDPAHSFVHKPSNQEHNDGYVKEGLFERSNLKSDSKDCQTSAEHAGSYESSASVPNLSGFGHPSALYESRTGVFNDAQPASQLDYTSSRSGSTLMRTPNVPDSKPSKSYGSKSSYKVPKSTAGSSKIFVVQAPENAYGHIEFKPQVPRETTSLSHLISHQHGSSQGTREVNIANSTFWRKTPVHSSTNPIKPPRGGHQFPGVKPSIVSSGPIFVVHGGVSEQVNVGYIKHPNSVEPLGVSNHVDPYVSAQASQTSKDALSDGSQSSISRNELRYSMRGSQYSSSPEPKKASGSDRIDNNGKISIASSNEILLRAPEGAQGSKLPSHEESHEVALHPRKFQQTYNVHGPSQSRSPIYYSVSGSQPNQILEPLHPSGSGTQHNVAKPSTVSSGATLIMQAPANVQSRTASNKPQVPVKPHTSMPGLRATSASGQTAPPYQPVEASQNSRTVQGSTSIYPSLKPSTSESSFSSTKSFMAGSNEINTVRVMLHKRPTSSFGNIQNQWVSGDNVGASSTYSGTSKSFHGQRPGENVQTPISSSVPQYQVSKVGGNADTSMVEVITIPSDIGQGVIRRLSHTFSSSNRRALQNQAQDQRVDSSAPRYDKTQNSLSGLNQAQPHSME